MKITLKNVKTFRGMEGHGLNADVYVDGVKLGFAIDDGNGGGTQFEWDDSKKDMVKKLEAYAASLPPITCTDFGEPFTYNQTVETLVEEAYAEWEEAKNLKKFEKKFKTQLIFGVKGSGEYSYVDFKRPMTDFPKDKLQKFVDDKKATFKNGQTIWNTNLAALGINI